MSIRATSPAGARTGVPVTFRTTRSGISSPPSPSFPPSIRLAPAGRARKRRRKNATKRTDFFRILPAMISPSLSLPLLDASVPKRIRSANRMRSRNRFLCLGLGRALHPSPPGSSSRRFSFDGTGGYPVHIEFSCGEVAGIVREPVGKIPGRPEKTSRPLAHLRGERRGRAARGPAGAFGGRRQLQGRQGFHRRRQGEGAGGRGPFLPLPRPALHQDRPRRDGEDDGGTGTGPEPGEAPAGPRDACGPAGIGEDDLVREAC